MLGFIAWILEYLIGSLAFIALIFDETTRTFAISVICAIIVIIFIKPVWNKSDKEDWNIKLSEQAINKRIKFYRVIIALKWGVYTAFSLYVVYRALFYDANMME
ncbi:MAG: hypothetical protein N2645_21270 [Clostridia bacterium]|nr:hypothetical protein [Clostridia bacterium]